MTSKATRAFWNLYRALPTGVRQQARGAFELFQQNPQHPGLRFKRVHPTEPIYSARIDSRHRAVGVVRDGTIIWFGSATTTSTVGYFLRFEPTSGANAHPLTSDRGAERARHGFPAPQ